MFGSVVDKLPQLLIFYPVLLFSLSFHESAHGWTANRLGDPTALLQGRITLNPLPHMDLVGTFILPIVAILGNAPLIGWGKPVPVNPRYFKNVRRDALWVALAGPVSNVILAVTFALFLRLEVAVIDTLSSSMLNNPFVLTTLNVLYSAAKIGVMLNLALACFNMIPVFPLDGGTVVRGLIPYHMLHVYDRVMAYGMPILLLLLFTGALRYIFIPVALIANILLP